MAVKWIKLPATYPKNDEPPKDIVMKKRKRRTMNTKTSAVLEALEANQESEQLKHADSVPSTADLVNPTVEHGTSTGEHSTSIAVG